MWWTHMGRRSKEEGIYVYLSDWLCYTAEKNSTVKQLYSNLKKHFFKNKWKEFVSLLESNAFMENLLITQNHLPHHQAKTPLAQESR